MPDSPIRSLRPMPEEGNTSRALREVMPRPKLRPRRMEEEADGFPDLNDDGKVTKADVLKGRGVEGFAEGGMVRGCKGVQMSGKKFSGTF
jgi:hypothetical protein